MPFVGLPLHNSWREELLPEIVKRLREVRPDLVRIEEGLVIGEAVCHFRNVPPFGLILREAKEDVVVYPYGEPAVRFPNPLLQFIERLGS